MFRRPKARPSERSVRMWARTSILGLVVAVLIVLGVVVVGDADFRGSFLSNFLATLAGVAVGVPIAVWLTLREADDQAKSLKEQEDKRAASRRREVLKALETELTENKETLTQRSAAGSREFYVPFLQDEVWAAMSDGGELRWVNDPDLLRQISRSYLFVRTVIYLEKQVFEIKHYAGMRIQGSNPEQAITGYLDHIDKVTLAAIDEGLAAIANVQP